jgi:hypothetical protein
MHWYAVKGLFRWYFKSDGSTDNVEERIVLFRAPSFDEAIDLAAKEAETYCGHEDSTANFRIESMNHWYAYRLFDEPADGVEVFSRRCATELSADAFVRRYPPRSHDAKVGEAR